MIKKLRSLGNNSILWNTKIRLYFLVGIWCAAIIMPAQAVINIGPLVIYKENTVEVLGPGPVDDPVDIQGVIDDITDEAADNPYLIKLGAGEYTITSSIQMARFISIIGAGEKATKLKGAISGGNVSDPVEVITTAEDVSLSNLSVENSGGLSTYSIAIRIKNTSPVIEKRHSNYPGFSS